MIFITGDTHGDFTRFSTDIFTEQKQMTKDDFVIVCGDFGLWHDTKQERTGAFHPQHIIQMKHR